jgi:steroid 5-alpha reductase family enzyme
MLSCLSILGLTGPLRLAEFFAVFVALPLFVAFAAVWWLARKIDNYSVVDPAWALGFLWPIGVFAFANWSAGHPSRIVLFGTMGALWSLRLGTYLSLRVARHHPEEDVRYQQLREKWKGSPGRSFFWFFQAQALTVIVLAVPFMLVFDNRQPALGALEWAGFTVWIIGLLGESLADWQMMRFKSASGNKGKVCNVGLWHYSRHPNYFFESLIWWGFWLFACGSSWGWVTLYAPLFILYLLLRVTGVPLTEECSVKSKGEAYREYQRTTSAFVPWFPKKAA